MTPGLAPHEQSTTSYNNANNSNNGNGNSANDHNHASSGHAPSIPEALNATNSGLLLTSRVSDDETDYLDIGSRKRRGAGDDESLSRKRMTQQQHWSQASHRAFVECIYDIGVKHASPSVILENMNNTGVVVIQQSKQQRSKQQQQCRDSCNNAKTENMITSERVKSHLQKYRKNRPKAKVDFMQPYDAWMQKALHLQDSKSKQDTTNLASPAALLEMVSGKALSSGEMAAFLSYSVMMDDGTNNDDNSSSSLSNGIHPNVTVSDDHLESSPDGKSTDDYLSYLSAGVPLAFPELTEAEKNSSIGSALLYVHDLFNVMGVQIEQSRTSGAATSAALPQQDENNKMMEPPSFRYISPPPTIPPFPKDGAAMQMSYIDHSSTTTNHESMPAPANYSQQYHQQQQQQRIVYPRCPPPGAPVGQHYRAQPSSGGYHQQQQQFYDHHLE